MLSIVHVSKQQSDPATQDKLQVSILVSTEPEIPEQKAIISAVSCNVTPRNSVFIKLTSVTISNIIIMKTILTFWTILSKLGIGKIFVTPRII